MEITMLAGILLHPLALAVLIAIAFSSAHFGAAASARFFSTAALMRALVAALVAAILVGVAMAYVSPAQSLEIGVQPGRYWDVLWRETVVLSTVSAYIGVVGASLVGVPVVVALARAQRATAPWLIATSVPISIVLCALLAFGMGSSLSAELVADIASVVAAHGLLALAFALGAGLPWRQVPRYGA